MTTELFNHPYLVYDKYGLSEVKCMASGKTIKSRMEEVSKIDPKRFVYAMGTHPNYREFPVLLLDGTVAFIMVSEDYQDVDLTPDLAERINGQIKEAKEIELRHMGKKEDLISAVLEKMKSKKVVRRLSAEEIKEKFGGKSNAR